MLKPIEQKEFMEVRPVVPALVAFFMLFQVNVVAQEKVEMEKSTTINTIKKTNKDLNPRKVIPLKRLKHHS
jgi:hypothetical protein